MRPGVVDRSHPLSGFGPKETIGPPRFPENPNIPLPCSQIPAGPRRLALFGAPVLPPDMLTQEAPATFCSFVTQSHGFGIHCLRFVPPSRTTTQDSFPVVASLFRVGLDTH